MTASYVINCVINVTNKMVQVLALVQQYQKSIGIAIINWYWYWQYILQGVLVLVLPIFFKSIINNSVSKFYWWSDNHKTKVHLGKLREIFLENGGKVFPLEGPIMHCTSSPVC